MNIGGTDLRLYEGMFLVDNAEARKDFDGVSKHVAGVIAKYGGDVKRSERWAERKLAYPVRRRDRGTYILVYFNASPESIAQIKRDCTIDDVIFRAMILKVSAMPQEEAKPEPVKAPSEDAVPPQPAEKQEAPVAKSEEPVVEDAVETAGETAEAQGTEQAADAPTEVAEVSPEVAEVSSEAVEVPTEVAEVSPEAVEVSPDAVEVPPEAAVPPEGSVQEHVGATDEKPEGEVTEGQAGPVEEPS
jgi:small subunit ribosomal protein S6